MEGESWVGGGVDLSLVFRGMVKGEGVRWVGRGLTSPLYTEGG